MSKISASTTNRDHPQAGSTRILIETEDIIAVKINDDLTSFVVMNSNYGKGSFQYEVRNSDITMDYSSWIKAQLLINKTGKLDPTNIYWVKKQAVKKVYKREDGFYVLESERIDVPKQLGYLRIIENMPDDK